MNFILVLLELVFYLIKVGEIDLLWWEFTAWGVICGWRRELCIVFLGKWKQNKTQICWCRRRRRSKWPREENFLVLTGRVTFSEFESVIISGSFGSFAEEGGSNSVNNSRNRIPARVFQLGGLSEEQKHLPDDDDDGDDDDRDDNDIDDDLGETRQQNL